MNILQICHKPPFPPIDGASIAMYNLYHGLTQVGHTVHVLAINTNKQHCDITKVPTNFKVKANYTLVDIDISLRILSAITNLFTRESYNITRFYSEDFNKVLTNLIQTNNYDLIIFESLYTSLYIDLARSLTSLPIILRTHNVEFKIWENLAKNETNIIKRWYLNLLSGRLKNYELNALKKASLIASISEEDNSIFRKENCKTPMIYLPFGINFDDEEFNNYIPPQPEEMALFHIGSMDWIPHQEAFRWFLEKVWPQINNSHPTIKLYLAGSKMPDWIVKGKYPNVMVTNGYTDGKSFMNNKVIMIVPSFSGSGIRVKIAEGMSKGKVIITTTNGAMGIPCTNNKNIFISDTSQEWINIINKCLTDFESIKSISNQARQFAQKEFD
jgi:polysaccharide biosynthesis protein PslH